MFLARGRMRLGRGVRHGGIMGGILLWGRERGGRGLRGGGLGFRRVGGVKKSFGIIGAALKRTG